MKHKLTNGSSPLTHKIRRLENGSLWFQHGPINSLLDLSARVVAKFLPFEYVEKMLVHIPEPVQEKIIYYSFPQRDSDIYTYASFHTKGDKGRDKIPYYEGLEYFQNGCVEDAIQIGFHLTGSVKQQALCVSSDSERRKFEVSITFDRCKIISVCCDCGIKGLSWCPHVVALALFRIRQPHLVDYRSPISDALVRMDRSQLQKFAQYLIASHPNKVLPSAQQLADQLLQPESNINQTSGAPDPTAGASVEDVAAWYLDETGVREQLRVELANLANSGSLPATAANAAGSFPATSRTVTGAGGGRSTPLSTSNNGAASTMTSASLTAGQTPRQSDGNTGTDGRFIAGETSSIDSGVNSMVNPNPSAEISLGWLVRYRRLQSSQHVSLFGSSPTTTTTTAATICPLYHHRLDNFHLTPSSPASVAAAAAAAAVASGVTTPPPTGSDNWFPAQATPTASPLLGMGVLDGLHAASCGAMHGAGSQIIAMFAKVRELMAKRDSNGPRLLSLITEELLRCPKLPTLKPRRSHRGVELSSRMAHAPNLARSASMNQLSGSTDLPSNASGIPGGMTYNTIGHASGLTPNWTTRLWDEVCLLWTCVVLNPDCSAETRRYWRVRLITWSRGHRCPRDEAYAVPSHYFDSISGHGDLDLEEDGLQTGHSTQTGHQSSPQQTQMPPTPISRVGRRATVFQLPLECSFMSWEDDWLRHLLGMTDNSKRLKDGSDPMDGTDAFGRSTPMEGLVDDESNPADVYRRLNGSATARPDVTDAPMGQRDCRCPYCDSTTPLGEPFPLLCLRVAALRSNGFGAQALRLAVFISQRLLRAFKTKVSQAAAFSSMMPNNPRQYHQQQQPSSPHFFPPHNHPHSSNNNHHHPHQNPQAQYHSHPGVVPHGNEVPARRSLFAANGSSVRPNVMPRFAHPSAPGTPLSPPSPMPLTQHSKYHHQHHNHHHHHSNRLPSPRPASISPPVPSPLCPGRSVSRRQGHVLSPILSPLSTVPPPGTPTLTAASSHWIGQHGNTNCIMSNTPNTYKTPPPPFSPQSHASYPSASPSTTLPHPSVPHFALSHFQTKHSGSQTWSRGASPYPYTPSGYGSNGLAYPPAVSRTPVHSPKLSVRPPSSHHHHHNHPHPPHHHNYYYNHPPPQPPYPPPVMPPPAHISPLYPNGGRINTATSPCTTSNTTTNNTTSPPTGVADGASGGEYCATPPSYHSHYYYYHAVLSGTASASRHCPTHAADGGWIGLPGRPLLCLIECLLDAAALVVESGHRLLAPPGSRCTQQLETASFYLLLSVKVSLYAFFQQRRLSGSVNRLLASQTQEARLVSLLNTIPRDPATVHAVCEVMTHLLGPSHLPSRLPASHSNASGDRVVTASSPTLSWTLSSSSSWWWSALGPVVHSESYPVHAATQFVLDVLDCQRQHCAVALNTSHFATTTPRLDDLLFAVVTRAMRFSVLESVSDISTPRYTQTTTATSSATSSSGEGNYHSTRDRQTPAPRYWDVPNEPPVYSLAVSTDGAQPETHAAFASEASGAAAAAADHPPLFPIHHGYHLPPPLAQLPPPPPPPPPLHLSFRPPFNPHASLEPERPWTTSPSSASHMLALYHPPTPSALVGAVLQHCNRGSMDPSTNPSVPPSTTSVNSPHIAPSQHHHSLSHLVSTPRALSTTTTSTTDSLSNTTPPSHYPHHPGLRRCLEMLELQQTQLAISLIRLFKSHVHRLDQIVQLCDRHTHSAVSLMVISQQIFADAMGFESAPTVVRNNFDPIHMFKSNLLSNYPTGVCHLGSVHTTTANANASPSLGPPGSSVPGSGGMSSRDRLNLISTSFHLALLVVLRTLTRTVHWRRREMLAWAVSTALHVGPSACLYFITHWSTYVTPREAVSWLAPVLFSVLGKSDPAHSPACTASQESKLHGKIGSDASLGHPACSHHLAAAAAAAAGGVGFDIPVCSEHHPLLHPFGPLVTESPLELPSPVGSASTHSPVSWSTWHGFSQPASFHPRSHTNSTSIAAQLMNSTVPYSAAAREHISTAVRTMAMQAAAKDPVNCALPALTLAEGSATAFDAVYRLVLHSAETGGLGPVQLFPLARYLDSRGWAWRAFPFALHATRLFVLSTMQDSHPVANHVLWACVLAHRLGPGALQELLNHVIRNIHCPTVLTEILHRCRLPPSGGNACPPGSMSSGSMCGSNQSDPGDLAPVGRHSCQPSFGGSVLYPMSNAVPSTGKMLSLDRAPLKGLLDATVNAFVTATHTRLSNISPRQYSEFVEFLTRARDTFHLLRPDGPAQFRSLVECLRQTYRGKRKLVSLLAERFG